MSNHYTPDREAILEARKKNLTKAEQRLFDQGWVNVVNQLTRREQRKTIEAQKKEITELKGTAYSDQLTALPNRHALIEKIFPRFVRTANRSLGPDGEKAQDPKLLGLIFCDIDKFKNFNDTYGHEAGDLALKHFAKVAENTFRDDTETAAARWGGEEFVVAFLTKDTESAATMAERFRKNLEEAKFSVTHEGQEIELNLTASFGVHTAKPPLESKQETLETLLGHADKALYEAKEQGRNRVVLSPSSVIDGPKEPSVVTAKKPTEIYANN